MIKMNDVELFLYDFFSNYVKAKVKNYLEKINTVKEK